MNYIGLVKITTAGQVRMTYGEIKSEHLIVPFFLLLKIREIEDFLVLRIN